MWPDHALTELLGIELPIIQAPMAGSSSLELAIAVSEAGGLGSIACAALDAEKLHEVAKSVSGISRKPFNFNFFAHGPANSDEASDLDWVERLLPYYHEAGVAPPRTLTAGPIHPFDNAKCTVMEEITPAVVSFHFGLPRADLVARLKAAGAIILSSATTVEEARWLVDNGCDAVIAQGYEAGGHRGMFLTDDPLGQIGTLALVPLIADAIGVPVVATGGIADGRGIAAAFALGASGVQIGTAYLFSAEAAINEVYRNALTSGDRLDTRLTNVFSGRPTRCLVNRAVREIGPFSDRAPAFPKGFSAMAPLRAKAERDGSQDFSALYCGQAAMLNRATTTAARLTRDLAADTVNRLRKLSGGADNR